MLIANQKRKENIAEYLLYMFQVEDLIRAYNFNIDLVDQHIIDLFNQPYSIKRDMRQWYSSLILIMQSNNLKEKGHISIIQSLIEELESFHIRLLQKSDEQRYQFAYSKVKISITTLRARSNDKTGGDIELCLNGLYGLLMLRLKKKTINPETSEAFGFISEMIAILSSKFLQQEKKKS